MSSQLVVDGRTYQLRDNKAGKGLKLQTWLRAQTRLVTIVDDDNDMQ